MRTYEYLDAHCGLHCYVDFGRGAVEGVGDEGGLGRNGDADREGSFVREEKTQRGR